MFADLRSARTWINKTTPENWRHIVSIKKISRQCTILYIYILNKTTFQTLREKIHLILFVQKGLSHKVEKGQEKFVTKSFNFFQNNFFKLNYKILFFFNILNDLHKIF